MSSYYDDRYCTGLVPSFLCYSLTFSFSYCALLSEFGRAAFSSQCARLRAMAGQVGVDLPADLPGDTAMFANVP